MEKGKPSQAPLLEVHLHYKNNTLQVDQLEIFCLTTI
jgi:hypothetical protein